MIGAWRHWTVALADPPAAGTPHHWVLRPCHPVADLLDLGPMARRELWEILRALVGGAPGWCMAARADINDPTVIQVDVTWADIDSGIAVRLPLTAPWPKAPM